MAKETIVRTFPDIYTLENGTFGVGYYQDGEYIPYAIKVNMLEAINVRDSLRAKWISLYPDAKERLGILYVILEKESDQEEYNDSKVKLKRITTKN